MKIYRKDCFRRGIRLMTVLTLVFTVPSVPAAENKMISAWWGTMYPRFCFQEVKEEKQEERKVTFWLAKVLDW